MFILLELDFLGKLNELWWEVGIGGENHLKVIVMIIEMKGGLDVEWSLEF
jgi:hypothetical protein